MFSGAETSCAYQSGEPIGDHRHYFLVPVLVRDYRSQSEGRHSVTGREGIAAVEELSMPAVVQGPLSPGSEFEDLGQNHSINQRLGAEQPRLTRLGIIRDHAAHVERGSRWNHGIQGAH